MNNVELFSDRRTINPSISTGTLQLILGTTGDDWGRRYLHQIRSGKALKRCGQRQVKIFYETRRLKTNQG